MRPAAILMSTPPPAPPAPPAPPGSPAAGVVTASQPPKPVRAVQKRAYSLVQYSETTTRFLRMLWVWLIVLACSGATARAHNLPGTAVLLDFYPDHVGAEVTLPLGDLELSFKQPLLANPAEALARHEVALKEYIAAHVKPETLDGRAWRVSVERLGLQTNQPPFDLVAHLALTPPPETTPRKVVLHYSLINHEVLNHKAMVSVRNDWDTAVFSGQPELLGMIEFAIVPMVIDRTRGSWWEGFRSVLGVGMHHIATGTDHLLFLLVLLLPAPLLATNKRWAHFGGFKRSLLQLLKIVTAFTVGHSLTLLIGALGWVRLPGQPVEILIALSILVSAGHAVRPWFAGRETWIAAGFGLVHGLAFAGSIAEYGFSPWYLASTILGFNLGIELMQLAVVAVTIPWLLVLSRTRFYTPIRIGGAVIGGLAALGWIVERAWAWRNPFEPVLNQIAAHPLWAMSAFAVITLIALCLQQLSPGKNYENP